MTDSSEVPSISVVEIGAAARAALHEGAQGWVLAVFRRSFYVRMTGKAAGAGVACFGPLSLGVGPLNALCDPPEGFPWPLQAAVGDVARVEGSALRIGAQCFRLDTARPWLPPPLAPVAPSRRAEGIALLRRVCSETLPARGLGALLLPTRDGAVGPASQLEGALHRAVSAAVQALGNWLASPTNSWPGPEALAGLLGLGGGLTPAGDDLLGGALIALRALGRHSLADRLVPTLLSLAPRRTGAISVAHLEAATVGSGAAPLHAALDALSRLHRADLEHALRRLDAIGHTSGWDALAGAAAVWGAGAPAGQPAGQTVAHAAAGHRRRAGACPWPAPEPRPC